MIGLLTPGAIFPRHGIIICLRVRIGLLTPGAIFPRHGEQFIPALDDILYDTLVLVAIFVEPPPRFRNEEHVVHTNALLEHNVCDNSRCVLTIEIALCARREAAEVVSSGADGQGIRRIPRQDSGKVAVICVRMFVEIGWEATAIEDIPIAAEVAMEAGVYTTIVPGLPLLAHLCCRHCGSSRCVESLLRAIICPELLGPLPQGCVARPLPVIGGMLTAPPMKGAAAREGPAVNAPPARNVSAIREAMRMAEHVSADSAPVRVFCRAHLCDVRLLLREVWAASGEATRVPR